MEKMQKYAKQKVKFWDMEQRLSQNMSPQTYLYP